MVGRETNWSLRGDPNLPVAPKAGPAKGKGPGMAKAKGKGPGPKKVPKLHLYCIAYL